MNYILNLKSVTKEDVLLVGGKAASLGEMMRSGMPVPDAFVVTSNAFEGFLDDSGLVKEIDVILHSVDHMVMSQVEHASETIQQMIMDSEISSQLISDIYEHFDSLNSTFVAVRSSATAEDGAEHAWAGQLETFLNTTRQDLIFNIKQCFASLFTPRAIFYRFDKGLQHHIISVAVVVQAMVNSGKSGVAFSVHPVTENTNQIIIEAGFGLGEAIVSGSITPDSYVISKDTKEIIELNVNIQNKALYRNEEGGNSWQELDQKKANEQVLSKEEIQELTNLIIQIENHYNFPVDIEWAFEGGKFYITQSRPITTLSLKTQTVDVHPTSLIDQFNHNDWTCIYDGKSSFLTTTIFVDLYTKKIAFGGNFFEEQTIVVVKNHRSTGYMKQGNRDSLGKYLIHEVASGEKKITDITSSLVKQTDLILNWLAKHKESNLSTLVEYKERIYEYYIPHINLKYIADYISKDLYSQYEEVITNARKYCEPVLKETEDFLYEFCQSIAIKESLNLDQVLCFSYDEMLQYFQNGILPDVKILDQRKEYSIVLADEKQMCFLDRESFRAIEKILFPEVNEIKGSTGYAGKIQGKVKIVIDPEQANNFQEGDVLVAGSTRPEFLPLMLKASAFVTDSGGMLSHAAITARELKKPCIIGTKIATQILKDGDLVEVDADNGFVRILKKTENKFFEDGVVKMGKWALPPLASECWNSEVTQKRFFEKFGLLREFIVVHEVHPNYQNPFYSKKFFNELKKQIGNFYESDHEYINSELSKFYSEVEFAKFEIQKQDSVDLKSLTNLELAKIFEENRKWVSYISVYDQFGWLSENILYKGLEEILSKQGVSTTSIEYNDYIFKLTKPFSVSTTLNEKLACLESASKIQKSLSSVTIESKKLSEMFGFMPVFVCGDPWSEEHYEMELNNLILKSEEDIEKEVNSLRSYAIIVKKEFEMTCSKLNLSELEIQKFLDFGIALDARNEAEYFVSFAGLRFIKILEEISTRLKVGTGNVQKLLSSEIIDCLLDRSDALEILEERKRFVAWGYLGENSRKVYKNDIAENIYKDFEARKILVQGNEESSGKCGSPGKAKGQMKICKNPNEIEKVKKGDILVTYATTIDYLPAMKNAAAIVTEVGGITCHAAVVSREFGIPCVIGLKNAMTKFKDGDLVEVDADNGVVRILKIDFNKSYTRDTSVIIQQAVNPAIFALFESESNIPPYINYLNDGVIEIWENQDFVKNISSQLQKIFKTDLSYINVIIDEYETKLIHLKEQESKGVSQDAIELKKYIDLVFSAMKGFFCMYFLSSEKTTPEPILNKVLKLRNADSFFDDSDKFIRKSLVSIYPGLEGLDTTLLRNEIEKLPVFEVLKQRKQSFVFFGEDYSEQITLKDFKNKEIKYNFEIEEPVKGLNEIIGQVGNMGKVEGVVRIVKRKDQIKELVDGEILVSTMTTPDFVPAIKKALAVITDEGGVICHAAILTRELNKPCIIGTKFATQVLKDGDLVEVDADKGMVKILSNLKQ